MSKCVICNEPLAERARDSRWLHGNNAQPVAEGQCCDMCERQVVLPARIRAMRPARGGKDAT